VQHAQRTATVDRAAIEDSKMKTGQAIIGANYGDEGKGLLTDFFASRSPGDSIVVRFNGGAQAGHTVISSDGRRHVFSHFGSGSFADCPTYLSKFFIVNPLLFVKEYEQLCDHGVHPSVIIHDNALLTTPIDMFINQTVERHRGSKRHGSCGLGINETVTRCLRAEKFRTRAKDMLQPKALFQRLIELSKTWLPERLKEFKVDPQSEDILHFLNKLEPILHEFIRDTQSLLNSSMVTNEYPTQKQIIFEGAQGLMLDEDRIDQFPHLTRSKTGLTNVHYLASRLGVDQLNVTYVSRTYLTRHGAGPLEGEWERSFVDFTNIPNQFQGSLRFAPLNMQTLQRNIEIDLLRAKLLDPTITADIAMTCLDQTPMANPETLSLPVKYVSHGPKRTDVDSAIAAALR
jgi:adenylosuccinate synthase